MLCCPGSPEKQNQKTFFIIIFILDSEFLFIYLCGIYPAWAGLWATFDLWLDIFHYIWSFSAIISSLFFSAHSFSLFSSWNLNLSFFSVPPLFPYSSLCFLFLFGSEFGCFFSWFSCKFTDSHLSWVKFADEAVRGMHHLRHLPSTLLMSAPLLKSAICSSVMSIYFTRLSNIFVMWILTFQSESFNLWAVSTFVHCFVWQWVVSLCCLVVIFQSLTEYWISYEGYQRLG